jgi:gentisate 1,2-dioxygenase
MKFPWVNAQSVLDKDKSSSYSSYVYKNADGSTLSKIIGAEAERIGLNASSPLRRETCSKVFHVYEGKGYSEIDDGKGNKKRLDWSRSDTFAVPAWSSVVHYCQGSEDAYLFSFSDKPLLENLGLYHEESQ